MAWLHATPKPHPQSRRGQAAAVASSVSRLDALKKSGVDPAMPPNPAPHIVERLIEIGLTEALGMGSGPLSWLSINEWQKSVRIRLSPWEARLIRRLSLAYLEEKRLAETESRPAPWRTAITERERAVEDQQLRMVLG